MSFKMLRDNKKWTVIKNHYQSIPCNWAKCSTLEFQRSNQAFVGEIWPNPRLGLAIVNLEDLNDPGSSKMTFHYFKVWVVYYLIGFLPYLWVRGNNEWYEEHSWNRILGGHFPANLHLSKHHWATMDRPNLSPFLIYWIKVMDPRFTPDTQL
jgi:hypothetical protein